MCDNPFFTTSSDVLQIFPFFSEEYSMLLIVSPTAGKFDRNRWCKWLSFRDRKSWVQFFQRILLQTQGYVEELLRQVQRVKKHEEIRRSSRTQRTQKRFKGRPEKRYKNEARFTSVRKETMDANALLELYKLFKQSNLKPNDIPTDIHFLRTLSFSSNATRCEFISNEMKINLHDKGRNRKNFYVSTGNNFSNYSEKDWKFTHNGEIIQEKYGALQHEAIHFLNEVVYGEQKNIKIKDMIEKSKNSSFQAFARYCCDLKTPSGHRKLLHKIYDDAAEMLCMYGIT